MTKYVVIVLAAATLMQPALSAGAQSTDSRPTPSSFVPHPHSNTHVYGTPIQPPIVGHPKSSHHQQTPKKRSASRKK